MNTSTQNLTILRNDSQEWSTEIEGEIGDIMVDGKRLSDMHDLTRKVEGVAQSIRTLVLSLGVIVLICLVCNVGMAVWVATHNEEITDAIHNTATRKSRTMDTMAKINYTYSRKLESLGLRYRNGDWQQIGNTVPKTSK